jgi:hypothetical protein
MNTKTYCPLGKIDCESFHKIETYREISDTGSHDGEIVKCDKSYFNRKCIEICPCPSKQQKIERYDMCEDQPAQIECRNLNCKWHDNKGTCQNISPAISLYPPTNYGHCFSFNYKPSLFN